VDTLTNPVLAASDALAPPHVFDPSGACVVCAMRGPLVGCIARDNPLLGALRASHAAQRAAEVQRTRTSTAPLAGQLRLFDDTGAPARNAPPAAAPVAQSTAPGDTTAADPAPDDVTPEASCDGTRARARKWAAPTVLLCAQCTLDVVRALAAVGRPAGGIGYAWATAAAGCP
jgi:hypothetical protein